MTLLESLQAALQIKELKNLWKLALKQAQKAERKKEKQIVLHLTSAQLVNWILSKKICMKLKHHTIRTN